MAGGGFYVKLEKHERDALLTFARDQKRTYQQQAAFIIHNALEAAGYLELKDPTTIHKE